METIGITSISSSAFTVTGNLIKENGSAIIDMGFYFSDYPPVLTTWGQMVTWHPPFKVKVTGQVGHFTARIDNLQANTQYFCQAYATNATKTGYGEVIDFWTMPNPLPAVKTNPPLLMTHSRDGASVVIYADLDNTGTASEIVQQGFCYSTAEHPTINDETVFSYQGPDPFTSQIHLVSNLQNLDPNKTYYARCFATNQTGTIYGNEQSFTVPTAPPPVIDREGTIYQTVKIGKQVWMAENLKANRYKNGDLLTVNEAIPGFYTWKAVSDIRGICPQGWHVPSDADWMELEVYLGMKSSEVGVLDLSVWRGYEKQAGALLKAVSPLWKNANSSANNFSKFGALPDGYILFNGWFDHMALNEQAEFCTSTESGDQQIVRVLTYLSTGVHRGLDSKTRGYSCRCVQD